MYVSNYTHVLHAKAKYFFTPFSPWKSALSAKRWFKTRSRSRTAELKDLAVTRGQTMVQKRPNDRSSHRNGTIQNCQLFVPVTELEGIGVIPGQERGFDGRPWGGWRR